MTDGFMLMIYGTSTGSLSIEQEGKMQLTNRGYQTPPIVDVDGRTIAQGEQGAHGPGGESVFANNCTGPLTVLGAMQVCSIARFFLHASKKLLLKLSVQQVFGASGIDGRLCGALFFFHRLLQGCRGWSLGCGCIVRRD